MPDISTLVEDIYNLFDPEKDHEVNEENVERFGEAVKSIVRTRLLARDESKGALRFSSLGKPDRMLWYDEHEKEKEPLKPKNFVKFLYGDLIEAMMVFLAKEAGHEVLDEQKEVECDGVLGHIDCTIDGVVVDVKSAAPYSYAKFRNGTYAQDVFSVRYLDQLCGYSNILTPEQAPAFFVMDKVSGDLCIVPVSVSIARDYKPEERIEHLKEVLAMEEPPERCYEDEPDGKSGNRKLGTGCSYCLHKSKCWPGLRGFSYSNGPKYLTSVERLPDVYEFEVR